MVDTLTTLSAEAAIIYDRALLYRAQQSQVFYDAGQKKNIAKRSGNQIKWRRFNALAVNTNALTEGATPTATALSQTEVSATVLHYGQYCEVTDMLDLLGIDPVIAEAVEVMGQQAGESVETIIQDIIEAGTSVSYATGSARASQAASNVITIAMLKKAVRTLDANNAMRFNGVGQNKKVGTGHYIAFMHPNQIYDLMNDSEWKNHQQYSAPEKLYNGELTEVAGVRIIQSTLAPVFTGAGSGGVDVYGCLLIGQHAFGVTDVAGTGKFKTIVKQIGSAGSADPLDQRGTIGWKSVFVSKILNNNFMTRIETGVTA